MLGERVDGRYELKRLLGSGALGAVYECELDGGKRIAVKLIHPEYGDGQEAVERFKREAHAACAVQSENVVQTFDFGRDPKLGLFLVLEFLDGESLQALLARERWVGEAAAAKIAVQIGRGLAKAHAASVVHGNLMPANVFLTRADDGSPLVKLLAFGISKPDPEPRMGEATEVDVTDSGLTTGAPQYKSPERIQGFPLEPRTDVWSLAAIAYEMLVGEPAVSTKGNAFDVARRIVEQDIPPLSSRASWVNPHFAALIDAALTRSRDSRLSDAATFVARILELFPDAGARASAAPLSKPTDVTELKPDHHDEPMGLPTEPRIPVSAPFAAPAPAEAARPRSDLPRSEKD
jgi:serine/threonine-protein kinase